MKLQLQKGPISHYGTQTVTTAMPIKKLAEIFKVDIYDPTLGRMGETGGYQRAAKKPRIKKLVGRLGDGLVVATSIVVNVRNPKEKLKFDSKGICEVNAPEEIIGTDGFHRASAWIEFFENAEEFGKTQEEVGEQLVNLVMYWGAGIVEEVNTFFDVNNNAKSIPTGNRLEMDAYLTRYAPEFHDGDPLLAEVDDLVYELAETPQWKDKIQWPNQPANVCPSSAIVRSCYEMFSQEVLARLSKKEKISLLKITWEAIEKVFPEIFNSTDKKKYSIQKAIGVTVVNRLVVKIYTDILFENNKTFNDEDRLKIDSVDVWVKYFSKMRKFEDRNMEGEDVDGLEFWLSGASGGAGAYSSGAGRNTLSKLFADLVLDK